VPGSLVTVYQKFAALVAEFLNSIEEDMATEVTPCFLMLVTASHLVVLPVAAVNLQLTQVLAPSSQE